MSGTTIINYWGKIGEGTPNPKWDYWGWDQGDQEWVSERGARRDMSAQSCRDIVGPVIGITDGRCHILTIQDRRSKYPVTTFIFNQEPTMVVDRLMAVWIPDFGLPGLIRSEMGKGFEEQVW